MELIKNISNIENIFTYFEFAGYDSWDEFDNLLLILTDEMVCKVVDKLEGIYSKHCILDREGFIFKLLYHEDFGNCLCSQSKMDEAYYTKLEQIAKEVESKLQK